MVEVGDVLSVESGDEPENYLVVERIEKMARNESGWKCIDISTDTRKEIDSNSECNHWRVTDRYLQMQLERGIIKVIKK